MNSSVDQAGCGIVSRTGSDQAQCKPEQIFNYLSSEDANLINILSRLESIYALLAGPRPETNSIEDAKAAAAVRLTGMFDSMIDKFQGNARKFDMLYSALHDIEATLGTNN